jgi:hypothetical protein
MRQLYRSWVEAQVGQTIELWNSSAESSVLGGPRYSVDEQQRREKVYREELRTVEQVAKKACRTKAERIATQDRLVASFARFSATSLDLERRQSYSSLPSSCQLAQRLRGGQYDSTLL